MHDSDTTLAKEAARLYDRKLVGLLIASPDLRICLANERYFRTTFQGADEVLGRKIQDLIMAEGVEARAKSLLSRIDTAATCCFDAFIRVGFGTKHPVRVTMAWIAPLAEEECVVVVLEDLLQGPDLAGGGAISAERTPPTRSSIRVDEQTICRSHSNKANRQRGMDSQLQLRLRLTDSGQTRYHGLGRIAGERMYSHPSDEVTGNIHPGEDP